MPRRRYLNKKTLAETLALFVDSDQVRRLDADILAEEALHRITAGPVFAQASAPHYHGAAMDGIAVRTEDTFGASETRPIELERIPSTTTPNDAVAIMFAPIDKGRRKV